MRVYLRRVCAEPIKLNSGQIGAFTLVYYFQKDDERKATDPRLGSVFHFAAEPDAPCTNCESQRDAAVMGSLSTSLTPELSSENVYGRDKYISMSFEQHEAELGKRLYWKLYKGPEVAGQEIELSELPSLVVVVRRHANTGIAIGDSKEAGEPPEEPQTMFGATRGKTAGAKDESDVPWLSGEEQ